MSANPPADAGAIVEVGAIAEARRTGHAFLAFRDGDGRSRIVVLGPSADAVTVGRRSGCDLGLRWDDQVSRLHARFERTLDGWELVDDGLSSNGTFINERRLHGRAVLHAGDVLRFGSTEVTFHTPQAAPAGPNAPTGPTAPNAPAAPLAQRPPAGPVQLSSTQRRVLVSLCRPYQGGNRFATPATDEAIAEDLVIAVGEVRRHIQILCVKLGIDASGTSNARAQLAGAAFAGGIVTEEDV